ncbi:MAG TPA: hypothetical protein VHQ41_02745 [Patescibacteria group bacterium]|nr:hypothetical protein [Patescibacteria group bacterium]
MTVAISAGAITAGTFVAPNIAHASCNPATQEQDYQSPTVSVSQPTGTYTDPGTINIAISGQLTYYCEGDVPPGGGGFGYQNTATAVNYRITRDSDGTALFNQTWHSPSCDDPLACLPGPYNISDGANASAWESGAYTIRADVYDNTLHSTGAIVNTSTNHFTVQQTPGAPGYEIRGSLGINSVNPNPADTSVTVTGTGVGGYWSRGGPRCYQGSNRSEAFIRMQLVTTTPANGPYPPGSSAIINAAYHNTPVPNYPTTYKVDGVNAGVYPLALNEAGSDVPGDPACDTVPDPMTYTFSFPINTAGLSGGNHTVTVYAWDESTQTEISSTTTFAVQHNALICDATHTVQSGTPAQYSVGMTGNPSGTISVTMSSNPSGPQMTNSPLSLNAGNSFTGVANVSTAGLAAGTYNLTFTGMPGSFTCAATLIVTAVPSAPQVDIKFNGSDAPPPLSSGTTSGTISWGNQNVVGCTASSSSNPAGRDAVLSPVWNGSYNVSPAGNGSQSVSGLQDNTTYTFVLNCTGVAGSNPSSDSDNVVVSIGSSAPVLNPSADIKCNGSDGPCTIPSGTSAILTWTSTNTAGNCTITNIPGAQPLNNPSPGITTGNLTNPPGSYDYTITCPGVMAGSSPPNGTDNVHINVTAAPPVQPFADIKCSDSPSSGPSDGPCYVTRGSVGYLTWASSNTTSCTLSENGQNPGFASLNRPAPYHTDSIDVDTTFTLACTGPGGSTSDSVTFIAVDGNPPPSVDLKCIGDNGQTSDGPCAVQSGNVGHLTWTSSHADNCTMSRDGGGQSSVATNQGAPGMATPTLTANTSYTITCSGPTSPVATDSVTFTITQTPPPPPGGGDDFTLACTPAAVTIHPGDSTAFQINTTKVGNFNDYVVISVQTFIPTPSHQAQISFSGNNQMPSATTTALVTTDGTTSLGSYTVVFQGDGGGINKTCNVVLNIVDSSPPPPPPPPPPPAAPRAPSVSADVSQCGKVTVNWSPNPPPTPSSYNVYRGNNSNPFSGSWQLIASVPEPGRSFTDNAPATSNNYYRVEAVTSGGSASSGAVLGNMSPCVPNINASDKDLTSVSGLITKNFALHPCNGTSDVASLPVNTVFAMNDKVTFRINVCNDGPGALTGVTVADTLKNLTNPTFSNLSPCVTGHSYNPGQNTIKFALNNVAPGNVVRQVCTIEFTATVTAPAVTTAALYRFQNIADISSKELPVKRVMTPPYLFSVTGGVPDRTETAPQ